MYMQGSIPNRPMVVVNGRAIRWHTWDQEQEYYQPGRSMFGNDPPDAPPPGFVWHRALPWMHHVLVDANGRVHGFTTRAGDMQTGTRPSGRQIIVVQTDSYAVAS